MAGHEGKRLLMDCGVDIEDIEKLAHELKILDKDGNGMVDREEVLSMRVEESPCLLCRSIGLILLRIHTYTVRCPSAFCVLTLLVHESEQFTEWMTAKKLKMATMIHGTNGIEG